MRLGRRHRIGAPDPRPQGDPGETVVCVEWVPVDPDDETGSVTFEYADGHTDDRGQISKWDVSALAAEALGRGWAIRPRGHTRWSNDQKPRPFYLTGQP